MCPRVASRGLGREGQGCDHQAQAEAPHRRGEEPRPYVAAESRAQSWEGGLLTKEGDTRHHGGSGSSQ